MKIDNIIEKDIKNLVDNTILARGKEYYNEGCVRTIEISKGKINAEVEGNNVYDVEIWIEEGEIKGICSCPYNREICKHIIATLYQWVNRGKDKARDISEKITKSPEFNEYLEKLSKEELVRLVSDLSRSYKEVKRDLSLRIATTSLDGEAITTIIKQFKAEFRNNNLDYYALPYVMKSIERIKRSMENASPEIQMPLLESFIDEATKAYEDGADDSDGKLGEFIASCIEDLSKAISAQKISFNSKKELFKKYFLAIEKDEYSFDESYFDLLLTIVKKPEEYNYLIDEVKKLIESNQNKYDKEGYKEFLIELYEKSGQEKEFLKEIEKKLEWSEDYLKLAEFWKKKNNIKNAIGIAQEGIDKRKNKWGNEELFRFLEDIYRQERREKDLLNTYREHFGEASSLPFYRKIKTLAQEQKFWNEIQTSLMEKAENHALIDILLDERNYERAIKEALTKDEDLPDKSREKVARFVKKQYPKEAIRIYDFLVEKYIGYSVRNSYTMAAEYAMQMKEVYLHILKNASGWSRYINNIRKEYSKRPALLNEFREL